jgi:hypothetical protein
MTRVIPVSYEGWARTHDGLYTKEFIEECHKHLLSDRGLGFANTAQPAENPLLVGSYLTVVPAKLQSLYEPIRAWIPDDYVFAKMQVVYSLFGEVRRIHTDASNDDITALYFANADWEPDHQGETLFYTPDRSEVQAAVSPVPGRVLIFTSRLPHRSGTPSILCRRPRIVVVFRFRHE